MKRLLILALLPLLAAATGAQDSADNPQVTLETSKGTIVVELFPDKAPKTVENFLAYAESGFYDGTAFHRVIRDFMVQVGGFTADLDRKPTRDPIQNESKNGLSNTRGTLAMARTGDPHSATAQFFINLVDNEHLNATNAWGYAVFGRVVEGMDVVDAIAAVPTGFKKGMRDVPREPVLLESVEVRTTAEE